MNRIDKHGLPGSLDQHYPDINANVVDVNDVNFDDDESADFGDSEDFSIRYDSSNDWFEIVDGDTPQDLIRAKKGGPLEIPVDMVPESAGTGNVGTDSVYWNKMHATEFKTHSPARRDAESAWKNITEYLERFGSMDIGERVADLHQVVRDQRNRIQEKNEKISELEERLEQLEEQI